MPNSAPSVHTVAFVLFDDVVMLDVVGPMQVLGDVRRRTGGRYAYEVLPVSVSGGAVRSDLGQSLDTQPLAALADTQVDTVIVAGGADVMAACKDARLVAGLQALAARSVRAASICTGAFLLARAGLLRGKRVVTHWRFCNRLQGLHPDVHIDPDRIYVQDGRIWTSGGVTAGIDMTLAMVEEDFSKDTALAVARELVVFPNRSGGQAQFTAPDDLAHGSEMFDDLHRWMADHIAQGLRVADLARRAHMSPRSFARKYPQVTGQSPGRALENARLSAAVRALVETGLPLKRVAARAGYGDYERMRRAFMRRFGISPRQYRDRFGRSG